MNSRLNLSKSRLNPLSFHFVVSVLAIYQSGYNRVIVFFKLRTIINPCEIIVITKYTLRPRVLGAPYPTTLMIFFLVLQLSSSQSIDGRCLWRCSWSSAGRRSPEVLTCTVMDICASVNRKLNHIEPVVYYYCCVNALRQFMQVNPWYLRSDYSKPHPHLFHSPWIETKYAPRIIHMVRALLWCFCVSADFILKDCFILAEEIWRLTLYLCMAKSMMMTSSNENISALLSLCVGNSPVTMNCPHKGKWPGALMFSLNCAWINGWVNNLESGDLRRHRAQYDVIVMMDNRSYESMRSS